MACPPCTQLSQRLSVPPILASPPPPATSSHPTPLSSPNAVVLLSLRTDLALARSLHARAFKCSPGGAEANVVLGTALLNAYAKCGHPDLARQLFDRMPVRNSVCCNAMLAGHMRNGEVDHAFSVFRRISARDEVSWTALIDGCTNNGLPEQALECFREMLAGDVKPDYVTVIAALAACADLGALSQGLWLHRYVLGQWDIQKNARLSNSLIGMYSRCGRVDLAYQVFREMSHRTIVSWNSMIVGFAMSGCSSEALKLFEIMRQSGFKPDSVSFTGALTACSHAGLVEEGLGYYGSMQSVYGLQPTVEHYGCVVNLLSRAGWLEDAMRVVEGMPMRPNEAVLGAILAACRMHGDISLAERLMGQLMVLETDTNSNYILLANIYAAIGRWDGVSEVRKTMKALGIKKRPGFSALEIGCDIHEFVAGDKSHPQTDAIYDLLDLLRIEMKLCD